MQFTAEYALFGQHRTDFPAVKHVNQQRFDNIIAVMGKSDLVAAIFVRDFKNSFATKARAQKSMDFSC